ncbi:MAG: carboxypeptidase regulatory-like domain-containing protein [Candidatus Micrarchaeota archaeon]
MGVTDSIKGAYFSLEDRYYRMLDWVDEKGIPVYKVVDAIESTGIPSFPVFIILVLIVLYLLFSAAFGGFFAGNSSVLLTVTDNQGTALEGASVSIGVGTNAPIPLLTDSQGKVRREFPKKTQLDITVSKDGFIQQNIKLFADSDSVERKILLDPQNQTYSKTVHLVHGVTGALFTDPVSVTFTCSANPSFNYPTTTNNGIITVENIPNDCGTLIATPGTAGVTFSTGTVDFLSPGIANLSIAEESAAKGTVVVSLTDQSGQPAAGVNIRLLRATGSQAGVPFSGRTTGPNGTATFEEVPVGRYYIVTYSSVNFADYDSSAVNDIKDVTANAVTNFSAKLSMVVAGKIKFTVKDAATRQPVPNTAVYLQKNGVTLFNTSTDAAGYAEFGVSDSGNVYSVRFDNPGYLIATLNSLGKSDSIIEVLLQPLSDGQQTTLEVLVTDQSNKPVENVQVLLKSSPSGDSASEAIGTGIDGKATFTRLQPGNYYADAVKEGFDSVTSSVVTVADRQINQLTIILPIGSGTVDVMVTDTSGTAVKGASVRAVDQFSGQELDKKNSGVDGKAEFLIRQDKKVFFEITASNYSRFTTVPVTPPADSSITVNVRLRQDIVRFEVVLDGLYVNEEKSSDALSSGQQYTARLLLLVPANASLSEAGVHIRTGNAQERITNLMESDYWNIIKVNAAASSVLKGLSFSPPTGFAQDATKVTTGVSKWANIVFKNPKGGVYQIEAQVQVLSSAPTGASLPFSYRAWGKSDSYVRFPIDQTLGNSESVPVKQGLYAKTNDKFFSVGPSSLCTSNFCYSLIIEDTAANLRSAVVDEYPAKSGQNYKLFFSLINNSATAFSQSSLELANLSGGLSMNTYRITDAQGAVKSGSFNGEASIAIPVADFGENSSLFGEIAFATVNDGPSTLDLTVKSNSQVAFQKTVSINVEAAKPTMLAVLPKTLAPFLDNDLIIRYSEPDQNNAISGANVDIAVDGTIVTSGLTDGAGVFHYTLQSPQPGAVVKVTARKPGFKTAEHQWQVTTNILSIVPDSVDETLTVTGVFGFERDFTITNQTQFPLRISKAGFSNDFNRLLNAQFVQDIAGQTLESGKDNNFSIRVELTDLAKRLLAPVTIKGDMIIVTENPNANLSWPNTVPITVHIGFGGEVTDSKCLTIEPVNWNIRTASTKNQALELKITNTCQVSNGSVSLRNLEAFLQQPASQNPLGAFVLSGELTDGSALANTSLEGMGIAAGGTTFGNTNIIDNSASGSNSTAAQTKTFTVNITHLGGYSPSTLTVNQGDTVIINATTEPGTEGHGHGITIDAFGINQQITSSTAPQTIRFVASQSGTFPITCGTCSQGTHYQLGGPAFNGTLIVNSVSASSQAANPTGKKANLQISHPVSVTLTNRPQIVAPLLAANSESVVFITFTPDASIKTGSGELKIILRGQHVSNNGVQPIVAILATTIQVSDLTACVEIVPPQITVYSTSPGIGNGIYGQYGYGGAGYYGAAGGYGGTDGYGSGMGSYGGGLYGAQGSGYGGGNYGIGSAINGGQYGYGGYGSATGPYTGGSYGGISGLGTYGTPGAFGSGNYGSGYNTYSGSPYGSGGSNTGMNRFDFTGGYNNYQSQLQSGYGSVNGNPTTVNYPEQLYSNNYPYAGYSQPSYDTWSPVASNGSIPNYNGYSSQYGQQFGGQFGNFNQFNSMYGRNNQFRILNHCQAQIEISFEPDPALLVDQPVLNLEPDAEQIVHVESTQYYGIYPLKVKGKLKDSKDTRENVGQLLVNVMPSGDPSLYDNCIQLNKRKFQFNDFVAKPQRATVINTCFSQGVRIDLDSIAFSNQGYGDQLAYQTGNPGLAASIEPLNLQTVPSGVGQYYQVLDFELYKNIDYRPQQIPIGGSITDSVLGIRSFASQSLNRAQGRAQLIVQYMTPDGYVGRKMFLVELQDMWSALPEIADFGNPAISPQQCVDPNELDYGACLTDADFGAKKTYSYSERQALRIGQNPYRNVPIAANGAGSADMDGGIFGQNAYGPGGANYAGVRNPNVSALPIASSVYASPYSTSITNPLGPTMQPSYASTTLPQPYPYYAQNYTLPSAAPVGIPASALNVCSPTDSIQIQTKSFEVGGVKFTFETGAGKQSSISGNSGNSAIKLTVDKTNAKGKGEARLNEKIKATVTRQTPFGTYSIEIPVKACVTLGDQNQGPGGPGGPGGTPVPGNNAPGTPTVDTKQADICSGTASNRATGTDEYNKSGLNLLLFNWNDNLGLSGDAATNGKACDVVASTQNYYCDGVQNTIELAKKTNKIKQLITKDLLAITTTNKDTLTKIFGEKLSEFQNTGNLVLWKSQLSNAIIDNANFDAASNKFIANPSNNKEAKAFFLKDNATITLKDIASTKDIEGAITNFKKPDATPADKINAMQQILNGLAQDPNYKNKITVEVTLTNSTENKDFIASAQSLGAEPLVSIPAIVPGKPENVTLVFTLNEFGYLHQQFKTCATNNEPTCKIESLVKKDPKVTGLYDYSAKFLETLANANLTPKIAVAVTKEWNNNKDAAEFKKAQDASPIKELLEKEPQVTLLDTLSNSKGDIKSNLIADNYSLAFKTDFAAYYGATGSQEFRTTAGTVKEWNFQIGNNTPATSQPSSTPSAIDSGVYVQTIEYSWKTTEGSSTVKITKALTAETKLLNNPLLQNPLDASLQNSQSRDYGTAFSKTTDELLFSSGTERFSPINGTSTFKQFTLSIFKDTANAESSQGRLLSINQTTAIYSPTVPYGFVLTHSGGKTGTLFKFSDAALNGKINWAGVNEGQSTPKQACNLVGDSQYSFLNNNYNGNLYLPIGIQKTTFSLGCAASSATMTIYQGALTANAGALKPTVLTANNKELFLATGTTNLPFEKVEIGTYNLKDIASAIKENKVCVKATIDTLELYWNPVYTLPSQAGGAAVTPPAGNNTNPPAAGNNNSAEKKKLVELVNAERQKQNLAALTENDFLDRQSQTWSEHLLSVGTIDHSTFAPENTATFFNPAGISTIDASQKFFDQWNNSSGHRQNMLNPNVTQIGVGIACSLNACFGVTQFGTSN